MQKDDRHCRIKISSRRRRATRQRQSEPCQWKLLIYKTIHTVLFLTSSAIWLKPRQYLMKYEWTIVNAWHFKKPPNSCISTLVHQLHWLEQFTLQHKATVAYNETKHAQQWPMRQHKALKSIKLNAFPESVKNAPFVDSFKRHLKTYYSNLLTSNWCVF